MKTPDPGPPRPEAARAPSAGAEARCAVCGFYTGPAAVCPQCGARRSRRLSLRVLRWAAVLLATLGLLFLYLAARHREIPRVTVAEISPTMNFAYVRLLGTVPADARVFRRPDGQPVSLRFSLEDGTGEIDVVAHAQQARALLDAGWRPRAGDVVEVAGGLQVTAGQRVQLRIQAPEHCRTVTSADDRAAPPAALEALAIGALGADFAGRHVTVSGRVDEVRYPAAGSRQPVQLLLRDGDASLPVVYWASVARTLSFQPAPGDHLLVRGDVGMYRERLQLRVDRDGDIRRLPSGVGAGP